MEADREVVLCTSPVDTSPVDKRQADHFAAGEDESGRSWQNVHDKIRVMRKGLLGNWIVQSHVAIVLRYSSTAP